MIIRIFLGQKEEKAVKRRCIKCIHLVERIILVRYFTDFIMKIHHSLTFYT